MLVKISLEETVSYDKGSFRARFYSEKKDRTDFNALLVECVTGHYQTKLKGATRVYLILEGSGTFTINGIKETAEQYDLFIISDGDVYEYEGAMKLFECNVPATDASNEENLS
jgi:hypothetical protein